MRSNVFIEKNKNILYIALATVVILLIPLAAMQFTDQIKWNPGDFIAMGILLFGAGLIYELANRRERSPLQRTLIGAGVVLVAFTLWVQMAVGIFD